MNNSPMQVISKTYKQVKSSLDLSALLREKAIEKAKSRIELSGKVPSDLTHDELEVITAEEEKEIIEKIKTAGITAALLWLGIA